MGSANLVPNGASCGRQFSSTGSSDTFILSDICRMDCSWTSISCSTSALWEVRTRHHIDVKRIPLACTSGSSTAVGRYQPVYCVSMRCEVPLRVWL